MARKSTSHRGWVHKSVGGLKWFAHLPNGYVWNRLLWTPWKTPDTLHNVTDRDPLVDLRDRFIHLLIPLKTCVSCQLDDYKHRGFFWFWGSYVDDTLGIAPLMNLAWSIPWYSAEQHNITPVSDVYDNKRDRVKFEPCESCGRISPILKIAPVSS